MTLCFLDDSIIIIVTEKTVSEHFNNLRQDLGIFAWTVKDVNLYKMNQQKNPLICGNSLRSLGLKFMLTFLVLSWTSYSWFFYMVIVSGMRYLKWVLHHWSQQLLNLCCVFATFGLPEQLVSDNGTSFTWDEFQSFVKFNGIVYLWTAPFKPQIIGQAEMLYIGNDWKGRY